MSTRLEDGLEKHDDCQRLCSAYIYRIIYQEIFKEFGEFRTERQTIRNVKYTYDLGLTAKE